MRSAAEAGIRSAYPHIDSDEIPHALRALTWTQDLLQGTPLQVEDYREVPARLYSRPVVQLSDSSLFVPRTAPGYALYILGLRLLEGNWPEELGPADGPLRLALERRRSSARPIDAFETELSRTLTAAGVPHESRVLPSGPSKASAVGVPLSLEVDAVVAVEGSKRVWVLEAKDLAVPFSARRIRSELDKYVRSGGHVDKLQRKLAEISTAPDLVAQTLGVSAARDFTVHGMFVTREPTPASCHNDVPFPFVTIDRLHPTLSQG